MTLSPSEERETTKVIKEKGTELSSFDKGRIIAQYELGLSVTEVAHELNLPVSTVDRIILHFKKDGNVENAPRPGRPPKKENE